MASICIFFQQHSHGASHIIQAVRFLDNRYGVFTKKGLHMGGQCITCYIDNLVQIRWQLTAKRLIQDHDALPVGRADRRGDGMAFGDRRLQAVCAEAAACLLRANRAIVTDLLEAEPGRFEIIDGDFLAGLAVRHLRQSSGVGRILAMPATISLLHHIGSDSDLEKKAEPESLLFWSIRRGRIQPCRQVGADIVDADGVVCDGANPESVIEALEERRLTPRLFLTHLLLSIVTNHRVIGGLRQLRYYPDMYDRTVAWLRRLGAPDWADELKLRHGWGHFLWSKPLLTAEHLINGTEVSDILRQHLNMSLGEASEDLRAFRTAN